MTVYEKIKLMSFDEFVDWFEENCMHDSDPAIKWWDETYCKNCEAVVVEDENENEHEYSFCELNNKCKHFDDMNDVPSNKQTIRMWLESEANN